MTTPVYNLKDKPPGVSNFSFILLQHIDHLMSYILQEGQRSIEQAKNTREIVEYHKTFINNLRADIETPKTGESSDTDESAEVASGTDKGAS